MSFQIEQLQLGYQHKIIIPDLSIHLPQEKIIALIGANGCGKSTLLKALARLLKPQKGKIYYQNQNILNYSPKDYAKTLSFLPQHHFIPEGITVRELVGYGRAPYVNWWGKLSALDEEKVEWAMHQTQVSEFANRLATDLSGGQQQRVFLAMVLAQDADLILLDEPTTYLDLNHQAELMNLMRQLQKQGKTIIAVLHDLNQACRYCDELVVLKSGQLVAQGSPHAIMNEALLKQAFDLNVEIHQDPVAHSPMFVLK
ncbi:MAG: Fe(3+) dicitrate ABC transporter ATP-binding protein FecE [Cardiobacteriaceae bacterium]|nr:Fe(3+) dicitrate ABC transporter ATP-binding protein FecE [Cardiobacteriaceae bacterium]